MEEQLGLLLFALSSFKKKKANSGLEQVDLWAIRGCRNCPGSLAWLHRNKVNRNFSCKTTWIVSGTQPQLPCQHLLLTWILSYPKFRIQELLRGETCFKILFCLHQVLPDTEPGLWQCQCCSENCSNDQEIKSLKFQVHLPLPFTYTLTIKSIAQLLLDFFLCS